MPSRSEVMSSVTELCSEAMIYLQSSEPSLAEEAYAAALDLSETELGESHFATLRVLELLARCMKMQEGKVDVAVPMLERLIELREEGEGREEVSMASVYLDLAECYRRTGREEEAGEMEKRSEKVMVVVKEKMDRQEEKEQEREEEEEEDDDEEEGSSDEEEDSSDEENQSIGSNAVEGEKRPDDVPPPPGRWNL